MALPSPYELDSYHNRMIERLRGISQGPQVSDPTAAVIKSLVQPVEKKSRLSSIKIPDATEAANSVRSKVTVAPLVMPTVGVINAGRGSTTNPVGSSNLGNSSAGSGSSGSSGLDSFLAKIGKKESGGNYSAVNKDSGALGKYQVMPANVASWTKQALGKSLTPQQFLKDTAAQEAVAKTVLGGYLSKYGEQGAAIAWYSGESNAKKFAKTGQVSTKSQGKYPTIAAYAASIAGKK